MRNLGIPELRYVPDPRRRRGGIATVATRRGRGGVGGGRDRARVPGVQRALRQPLRQPGGTWSDPAGTCTCRSGSTRRPRPTPSGTSATCTATGSPTPISAVTRGRPANAATNPNAWFYEPADHAGRAPVLPLDRRADAAPARLLPGERRRRGAGGDLGRPGRGPPPSPGADRGRQQGHLPPATTCSSTTTMTWRRSPRRRPWAGGSGRRPARRPRHRRGDDLRELQPGRVPAAGGARVLRPG